MKIAVDVTPILPGGEVGGAKHLVLELLRGLARRAHSDQFVLLTSFRNHHIFEDLERLGMTRVRVLEDPSVKQPSLLHRLVARLKSELTFYAIPGFLKKQGISVLFCPMTAPYYSEVGIPTVSIVYDLQHLYYPSFFSPAELTNRRHVYDQVKKKVDFSVCISSYTRESVITKLAMAPDQVIAIPIAVHSRLSTVPEDSVRRLLDKYGLLNKKYFMYPANLWPHKNHKMLLTAFNMFNRRYPRYDLHLVMTGAVIENDAVLKDALEQMKLVDRVHFLGYLDEDELAAVWSRAYALIFPSLFEGFGIPLVEAMMFGKPIIASNSTSIPEVAGEAALYFDPKKPGEIVNCLAELVEDRTMYDSLVAKGQDQIKKFDFNRMVDEYLAVLHKVAKAGSVSEFVEVSGAFEDGWAGSSLSVSFGASTHSRLFELKASLPDWHPREQSRITLKCNKTRNKRYSLRKHKPLHIKEHLPHEAGAWIFDISGGFIPGNGDQRMLSFRIEDLFVVDEATGDKIYEVSK
jgi:glycosyltransferase involved in cell wall biosynthesis